MWHEARKQEKLVRKVIVDYRKRAERRQEYYEKIKQDPTKFMQVHGRKCKLHIDEGGIASDSNSYMMPWQGDKSNMIDRFDVRAHLDIIPNIKSSTELDFSTDKTERKCQYERYRILIYNKHRGITESQHLKKIHINEAYPELTAQKQEAEAKKQMLASSKATIAYSYEGDGSTSHGKFGSKFHSTNEEDEDDEDDWSDEDFFKELEDVPSVNELNMPALSDLESLSFEYGLYIHDFTNSLKQDQTLQDKMDKAKALENEKAKMAGKKSRRERRLLKDNRLKNRSIGPLSYILHEADESGSESGSNASNVSSSSEDEKPQRKTSTGQSSGQIEFITSFGDTSNEQSSVGSKTSSRSNKAKFRRRSRSRSRSRRSRSPDRRRRSRSNSRESSRRHDRGRRSSERDRHYRRSRSHERHRRSRSRSRSRHSRSPERTRRSRSRSKGPEKPFATVKSAPAPKTPSGQAKKLTPQERLKVKMQRALKKQLKADRVATADKRAKAYQEQMDREEELREMTRKIRKREDGRPEMDSPLRSYRSAYY